MTDLMTSWRIMPGDCRESLAALEPGSVQTVVTSPPYFGLRDYGTAAWDGGDPDCDHKQGRPGAGRADGVVDARAQRNRDGVGSMGGDCRQCGATRVDQQIGLEPTPDEYVTALVEVFRSVRRVLRDDGTVWLNLGDSYAGSSQTGGDGATSTLTRGGKVQAQYGQTHNGRRELGDAKPKDLIGVPWMVAFALRADGWYLRSDIIWAKPNPMPESVTDRPTKAHEYLFLLSKGPRYFYDADAIREDNRSARTPGDANVGYSLASGRIDGGTHHNGAGFGYAEAGRNKRSVWTVATQPYPGAHFATFPPKLIEPCILAGASPKACGVCGAPWRRIVEREGADMEARYKRGEPTRHGLNGAAASAASDLGGFSGASRTVGWEPSCDHQDDTGSSVVLDPFSGAGTTGIVALRHNRSYIGCELSPEYVELSRWRIVDDAPLLNSFSEAAA